MKYNNINCIIFAKDKINREPAEFSLQRSTEGKNQSWPPEALFLQVLNLHFKGFHSF